MLTSEAIPFGLLTSIHKRRQNSLETQQEMFHMTSSHQTLRPVHTSFLNRYTMTKPRCSLYTVLIYNVNKIHTENKRTWPPVAQFNVTKVASVEKRLIYSGGWVGELVARWYRMQW